MNRLREVVSPLEQWTEKESTRAEIETEVLDEVFPWGISVTEEARRITRKRRRRECWAFAGILITGLLGVAVVLLAAYGLMVVR